MSIEVQDRDAIVSRAIEMASATERDAYIAEACGDDAELKRQVQERVAAHLQSRNGPGQPAVAPADGAAPPEPNRKQADSHPAVPGAGPSPATPPREKGALASPRLLATAAVLLLAIAAVSACVAVWAWKQKEQAQTAEQQAAEEHDRARKEAAQAKEQCDRVEAERQRMAEARDQELAREQAAQHSAEDTKAVLDFLQSRLLSACRLPDRKGGPKGWPGGLGPDVKLKEAVNRAEAEVSKAFADKPLAEASIRAMFGSTYLDLEEPAMAVKQYERALLLREAWLGPNDPSTIDCRNWLNRAYREASRTGDGSHLYAQNAESTSHADALAVEGAVLLEEKKYDAAALKLRECLTIRQQIQPNDWTTFDAQSMLGEALLDQKKYADAEPLLLKGYEGLKQRQSKIPSQEKVHLTKALERLVRLYEARNKKDEAARWRKQLEAAKTSKKL